MCTCVCVCTCEYACVRVCVCNNSKEEANHVKRSGGNRRSWGQGERRICVNIALRDETLETHSNFQKKKRAKSRLLGMEGHRGGEVKGGKESTEINLV